MDTAPGSTRTGHEMAIAIPAAHAAGVGEGNGGRGAVERIGGIGRRGGQEVRDVFGLGVFGADGGDAGVGGFTGFGEGVVARVEVFALLVRGRVLVLGVGQIVRRLEEGDKECGQMV